MTIDDQIRMKNHSIFIEKLQKYLPYHHVKLINMNILQVEKYCLLIKDNRRN